MFLLFAITLNLSFSSVQNSVDSLASNALHSCVKYLSIQPIEGSVQACLYQTDKLA